MFDAYVDHAPLLALKSDSVCIFVYLASFFSKISIVKESIDHIQLKFWNLLLQVFLHMNNYLCAYPANMCFFLWSNKIIMIKVNISQGNMLIKLAAIYHSNLCSLLRQSVI